MIRGFAFAAKAALLVATAFAVAHAQVDAERFGQPFMPQEPASAEQMNAKLDALRDAIDALAERVDRRPVTSATVVDWRNAERGVWEFAEGLSVPCFPGGRPVELSLEAAPGNGASYIEAEGEVDARGGAVLVRIKRDDQVLASVELKNVYPGQLWDRALLLRVPPSSVRATDAAPPVDCNAYTVEFQATQGSVAVHNVALVAREL